MSEARATRKPLLDAGEVRQLIAAAGQWRGLELSRQSGLRGRVGDHSARALGSGLDYAESRVYQPGDEPRHINWRASARSRDTQVRVFHRDINPQVCLLVDRRAAMRFGTRSRLKVTQALRLALFLAAHETGRGHEVACLDLDGQTHWLPAKAGPAALQQLVSRLNQPCPPLDEVSSETDMAAALSILQARLPRGSRLYLLSDFADLGPQDLTAMRRLALVHSVWGIRIHDPAEQRLPVLGPVSLAWGGERSRLDADRELQRRQADAFERRRADLVRLFGQSGALSTDLSTDQDDLAQALSTSAMARTGGR